MSDARIWCVIPAAGSGRRMGADLPKQYLKLAGRALIEHTLEIFCRHPGIAGVMVAVAPDDARWERVRVRGDRQPLRCDGGSERFESVRNALEALRAAGAADDDWALVHDAVRPCVRPADIDKLIRAALGHPVGAVLGMRVSDTMKRVDGQGEIRETVSREGLWRAFTPQMFRLARLDAALGGAIEARVKVTDEAQAMERAGAFGVMVEGHADNLKITTPLDLELAEHLLAAKEA